MRGDTFKFIYEYFEFKKFKMLNQSELHLFIILHYYTVENGTQNFVCHQV